MGCSEGPQVGSQAAWYLCMQSARQCQQLTGQVHGRDGLQDPASEGVICQVWPQQGTVLQWSLCRRASSCAGSHTCLAVHTQYGKFCQRNLRPLLQAAVQQSLHGTAGCWSR